MANGNCHYNGNFSNENGTFQTSKVAKPEENTNSPRRLLRATTTSARCFSRAFRAQNTHSLSLCVPKTNRTNLKPLSQTSSGPFRSGFLSPETLLSPSRRSGRRDWLPFRHQEPRKSELSAEIPRLGTHPDRHPSDFRAQRAQIATDSESPRLSTHRSGQRAQIATDSESPRLSTHRVDPKSTAKSQSASGESTWIQESLRRLRFCTSWNDLEKP